MRLGYELTIEQKQVLKMTPELIQAIQILQFNALELDQYIKAEMMQNPVLELDEQPEDRIPADTEISHSEKMKDAEDRAEDSKEVDLREKVLEAELDDISYKQWQYSKDRDEVSFEQFVSKEETLRDSLLLQLTLSSLKGRDERIGRYLIEAIDDNGYLTVSAGDVASLFGVKEDRIEDVLDVIQTFEPCGVGARTLEECLLIQLRAKGLLEVPVQYIVLHNMKDIADNRMGKISKETGLTVEQVQMIADLIRTLEPKPGRVFASENSVKYIIPDVVVEKNDGEYQVMSNESTIPHLIVSPYYMGLARQAPEDEELKKYLNEKYDQAMWLIKSIEQRKQTIYNVVSSVIAHQIEFFEYGPKFMKTLTLKQVAADLDVHESTVSRSINGKYMQTPRGVFEIKYFFSSGVTDSSGEGISSNSIKTFIREIIDGEDVKNPYSDQEIIEILQRKGIRISRRTVAKYREGMGIQSSPKRRRY